MNRIRLLRKGRGWTMKELGRMIGVAESTISQYETEKRSPDNETLLKLGELFDCSVDYILGREERRVEEQPTRESVRMLLRASENATDEQIELVARMLEGFVNGDKAD